MRVPSRLRERLLALFRKERIEGELAEEIQFHIEMETEKNIRLGLSAKEARRAALLKFGGVERTKEEVRGERGVSLIEEAVQDLRYGARALRQNRGFAFAAICTLALGIGASTAVFSVLDAVLLRPLPYAGAEDLVLVWNRTVETGPRKVPVAAPDVAVYREQARLFEDFAFSDRGSDAALNIDGKPRHVRLGRVSVNLFSLLGVAPAIGRDFSRDDIIPLAVLQDTNAVPPAPPLILSYELWRLEFGSDSSFIGRSLELNGVEATIVGVMPEDFALLLPDDAGVSGDADIWSPVQVGLGHLRRVDRLRDQDTDNTGAVIARLKDGVSIQQAQAEMDGIAGRLRRDVRAYEEAGLRIGVHAMHDEVVGRARPVLLAVLGAVVLVLVIACINVANLLLVRNMGRQRELALRSALGARRVRLVRQVLTESALLALLGGAVGVVLATVGVDVLLAMSPQGVPRVHNVRVDGGVLTFALVVTVLAAVLFGTAPALMSAKRNGNELLRTRGRDSITVAGQNTRSFLVASQVALSLVLLIGAGLMLRSLVSLTAVRPGFEAEGVLTFGLSLRDPVRLAGPADRARFIHRLEERVSSLPGVEAVGLVGRLPLSGQSWTQPYGLEGESEAEWSRREADFRTITSGYFSAMGVRLLAGRRFTADEDVVEDRRVVIVDDKMARRIVPDGNAIGSIIGFPLDGAPVWAEVVGVVEHVRYEDLREEGRETLYVPYRQEASREVAMVARTSGDPAELVGPVRDALRALESGQPFHGARPLDDLLDSSLAPTRFVLSVLAIFGATSLIVAIVGLYGVLSYWVRQRTHELGIRMALGARAGTLVHQVVKRGLALTGAGIVVGLAVSLLASRALESLLFGVGRTDAATLGGISLLLTGAAAAACYLAARGVTRVDPVAALRAE